MLFVQNDRFSQIENYHSPFFLLYLLYNVVTRTFKIEENSKEATLDNHFFRRHEAVLQN